MYFVVVSDCGAVVHSFVEREEVEKFIVKAMEEREWSESNFRIRELDRMKIRESEIRAKIDSM